MEEEQNESGSLTFGPENNIRLAESEIQAQLKSLKINSDAISLQTSYFCDKVKDQILYYDDEPQLSKNSNNCRRIYIASELFFNICSIYGHIVDYEFGKIISGMVQWEKCKQLARKITSKVKLELKKEKFFNELAQRKLLKSVDDIVIERINEVPSFPFSNEVPPEVRARRGSETEFITRCERENLPEDLISASILPQIINETLVPSDLESSFRNDFPSNITEIRGDSRTDTHHLELPLANISRDELSLPTHQTLDPDISIGGPTIQQKNGDEIDQILNILEDIFPKDITEVEQPEKTLEPSSKGHEMSEELIIHDTPNGDDHPVNAAEDSDEWSLPSIKTVEKTPKKCQRLKIDKTTIIPSYAARAMKLNRNIDNERVQVFEGPPTLLQEMSATHLMKAPGYKPVSLRSERLSTLYNRQLEVEKRNVEVGIPQRRTVEERSAMDISKVRTNGDILEDVGIRAGMRSILGKSDILVEAREKTHFQELDITIAGGPTRESLVGVPISRIINSTIEPPDQAQMERINEAQILPIPRPQQLQGKTLDPKSSPPWFLSSTEKPPNAKYRKFDYVFQRLQNYWSMCESQGMEKCITLNEFFSFEGDANKTDFMTVLRIVDKMSIQRKLVLRYKDGDVFICPFESPYVTDTQLLLKEREGVF